MSKVNLLFGVKVISLNGLKVNLLFELKVIIILAFYRRIMFFSNNEESKYYITVNPLVIAYNGS